MPTAAGVVFGLSIFLAACFGVVLEVACLAVLYPFPRAWSRSLIGVLTTLWFELANFLLIHLLGLRIHVHGDALPPHNARESALVISNHPTRVDWMLLWPLFAECGNLADLKIVLKAPLRKIPAIGWHIQLANFIFLERDLSKDREYIRRACDLLGSELAQLKRHPTVLIFPEGTDLSKSNLAKAHAYSELRNLPKFERVLHPRTTGLRIFFDECHAMGIEHVYDLTLAYEERPLGTRPSEQSIVGKTMPKAMHVHFRRYDVKELGQQDQAAGSKGFIEQWCKDRFAEKDARLKDFYRFPAAADRARLAALNKDWAHPRPILRKVTRSQAAAVVFWAVVGVAESYLLWHHWPLRIYVLLVAGVFAVFTHHHGGLDRYLLKL